MSNMPMLGAAIPVQELEPYVDWLVEGGRDLELQSFHSAEVLNGEWLPLSQKARQLLANHDGRLGIHGPFPGFSIASEDPDIQAVVRRRLMQGLDVCEELGATQMVIHSPYKGWDYENLENSDEGPELVVRNARICLTDAVDRAERLGVQLVLETIEDRDPHARVDLAKRLDSPSLKVSIDTGHAYYAHCVGNAPAVDRYVRAAGDMLAHVHLQDADGFADRHWALGDGSIPWVPVFEELGKLTSNPRLIIELRDKSGLRRSARFLEAIELAR